MKNFVQNKRKNPNLITIIGTACALGLASLLPNNASAQQTQTTSNTYPPTQSSPSYRFNTGIFAGQQKTHGIESGIGIGPFDFSVKYGKMQDNQTKDLRVALSNGREGRGFEYEIDRRLISGSVDVAMGEIFDYFDEFDRGCISIGAEAGRINYNNKVEEWIENSRGEVLSRNESEKSGKKFFYGIRASTRNDFNDPLGCSPKREGVGLKSSVGWNNKQGFNFGLSIVLPLSKK